MTVHLSTAQRSLITPTHMLVLSLLAVVALMLVGFYLVSSHIGVTSTSTATPSEAPVSQPLDSVAQPLRSDCAVTGDLAGDANPAEIAAVMCREDRR